MHVLKRASNANITAMLCCENMKCDVHMTAQEQPATHEALEIDIAISVRLRVAVEGTSNNAYSVPKARTSHLHADSDSRVLAWCRYRRSCRSMWSLSVLTQSATRSHRHVA